MRVVYLVSEYPDLGLPNLELYVWENPFILSNIHYRQMSASAIWNHIIFRGIDQAVVTHIRYDSVASIAHDQMVLNEFYLYLV